MDVLTALRNTCLAMVNALLLIPIARPTLVQLALNASQSTVLLVGCASRTTEDVSITRQECAVVPVITSLAALANALS